MRHDADSYAVLLEEAWTTRKPIEPLSAAEPGMTVEQAYAIQRAWAAIRAAEGEKTIGRKIGLTSTGMREQMSVNEPDFGDLWASRRFQTTNGATAIAVSTFLQPRVEGELAFLMEHPLRGPNVGPDDVLDAAAAVAPALEIVDSRISDWRIRLADTIADNASYGGFVVGEWSTDLLAADLRELPLEVRKGDEVVVNERGSEVLGSPALAVAWLANRLGEFGQSIEAGDIVLSGAFGRAVPAQVSDRFAIAVPGAEPLLVEFEE